MLGNEEEPVSVDELLEDAAAANKRPGALSDADDLRQLIEVLVACVQDEIVLKNQRRQPDVVCGNRRSLFPQLQKESGIVMRRLVVSEEDVHGVFQEEASQRPLVLRLPAAMDEARSKLAEHDERHDDGLSFLQECHCFVESDLHSQRSLRFRGAPLKPVPSASASMTASFRLLPAARARSRRTMSRAVGMPRTVYCMHRS